MREVSAEEEIEAEKIFRRVIIVIVMMRWLLCDFEIPDSVMTSAGGFKKSGLSVCPLSFQVAPSSDALAFCVVFL